MEGSDFALFSASESGLLAYHSNAGQSQLTWYDRSGRRTGTLGEPAVMYAFAISPDGQRVAAAGDALVVYEVARGIRSPIPVPDGIRSEVAWSPDGKKLLLAGRRRGLFTLVGRDAVAAGGEEVIYEGPRETLDGSWAPNGTIFFAQRNPGTQWDLDYMAPGSHTPVPLAHSAANETFATLSPDGRLVAFASDESGVASADMYVARFPDLAHRKQVSTMGSAICCLWGPNGREIFFASQSDLMSVTLTVGPESIDVSTPKRLFSLKPNNGVDMTRDGSKFLVLEKVGAPPPVVLVQGWGKK
jgi:Tol biopolymer transport system component